MPLKGVFDIGEHGEDVKEPHLREAGPVGTQDIHPRVMFLLLPLPDESRCHAMIVFHHRDGVSPGNPLVALLELPDFLHDLVVAFYPALFLRSLADPVGPLPETVLDPSFLDLFVG